MNQAMPSDEIIGALQRAQCAHQEGRFDHVEKECRWVIERQPDNAEAWVFMSTVARDNRRLPEAVEMLRRAIALQPENGYIREALAELYVAQRDWRNAQTLYRRLYDERKELSLLHALGRCAWGMGRYEEALGLFEQAADAPNADPATQIGLAQACISLDRPARAHATLQTLLKQHPRQAAGWMLLALLEFRDKAPQRAIELMSHAAKLAESNPKIHQLLAALLTLANRPDAARDALRKVPENPVTRAEWESFQYVRSQLGGARIVGFNEQVLSLALEAANLRGLTLEFGVYFGRSLGLIAERVKSDLHGFDSLKGLPEDWNPAEPAGSYSTDDQAPQLPAHAQLHAGWFEETLPAFFVRHKQPIRLAHIDCDLYSSTHTVLEAVLPNLRPGSVLVFDDYLGYPGYEEHEFKAFQQFVSRHELQYRYLAFGLMERAAAVELTRVP